MTESADWISRLISSARSIAGFVLRSGVVFGVAGVIVWTIPALPIDSTVGAPGWLWRAVLLIVLVAPAGVILLFGAGLRQLSQIPPQLAGKIAESTDHAKALIRQPESPGTGRIAKVKYVAGGLWRIGRASLDARDTVLGGIAIARLFNPTVLVVTLISALLGTLLTVVGAIRGLWWMLT